MTAPPVLAQFSGTATSTPTGTTNPGNTTSGLGTEPGGLDVFSLIHRANLANPKSLQDFTKESDQGLIDEVARYRARTPLKISPEVLQPVNTPVASPP
ncbi:hypothetical protein [Candidatus Cyanaurora vandensis]|uniref:hypothetical protein n=1 Tax=Candidatus Cyanaurora vandensis TaxID=2714958 RepID=UPI00257C6199|nr:hypothetical protein [Candidatus Cyanaurora vandensis]